MNLHALVADSARRAPGRLAVTTATGTMTYGELDVAADVLADELRRAGVGRGDRVVIWLDKSAEAVVAMQAVLRLGASYVPLGGDHPAQRTIGIALDCAARLVVTDHRRADQLTDLRRSVALHVVAGVPRPSGRTDPVAEPTAPDDLAYILYTSGSTGEPKGVCITHRNAMAFVRWVAVEIDATERDRFSNHAPFSFDLSVLDLYVAFLVGASVHLIASELAYAPTQLVDFVRQNAITIWYSVPSVLVLMIRDGGLCSVARPPALRVVLFAGEPFPVDYLALLYRSWGGARLLNLYGPTETNVCTFHEVTEEDVADRTPIPIGRACSGDDVWVEGAGGVRAGVGEEGELVVAGPTVMAGYWGAEPQKGPYRTGDLARVRSDGGFDYLGRRDHLVKVRGHRVELGEIEAVLTRHPQVLEAVVVLAQVAATARLVAFVVPADEAPGLLALKRHCAEWLPRYMIIDSVSVLPELPRTRNGKTDRRRLRSQAEAGSSRGG